MTEEQRQAAKADAYANRDALLAQVVDDVSSFKRWLAGAALALIAAVVSVSMWAGRVETVSASHEKRLDQNEFSIDANATVLDLRVRDNERRGDVIVERLEHIRLMLEDMRRRREQEGGP